MTRTLRWGLRIGIHVGGLTLLSYAGLLILHVVRCPITFQQFQLHRLNLSYGLIEQADLSHLVRSAGASGWNMLTLGPQPLKPALDQPLDVFGYVFAYVPPYAVVYPTEGFYYFSMQLAGRQVMGNLRIADLEKEELSFAYFTVPEKETWLIKIDRSNGLSCERKGAGDFVVTYGKHSVRFVTPSIAAEPPIELVTLPEEEFVGTILDESGMRFFLLYNTKTDSFYDVLDDEGGTPESFAVAGDSLVVGRRTGFAFYDDREARRKILIGVPLGEVRLNSFFDGPGDQVPIGLDIRDKLYRAYPHTMLGAGIDAKGVFLNKSEWMRVAVSPFLRYSGVNELLQRIASCDKIENRGDRWTCLTKEWWNNDQWRERTMKSLAAEGKSLVRR